MILLGESPDYLAAEAALSIDMKSKLLGQLQGRSSSGQPDLVRPYGFSVDQQRPMPEVHAVCALTNCHRPVGLRAVATGLAEADH